MLLSLDGHEVRTVYSARAALDELRTFAPDVVLLEIRLPETDGYAVARRIREQPTLARVKLIALTGYGQHEDRQRARAAGFDGHLVKPVGNSALRKALFE